MFFKLQEHSHLIHQVGVLIFITGPCYSRDTHRAVTLMWLLQSVLAPATGVWQYEKAVCFKFEVRLLIAVFSLSRSDGIEAVRGCVDEMKKQRLAQTATCSRMVRGTC